MRKKPPQSKSKAAARRPTKRVERARSRKKPTSSHRKQLAAAIRAFDLAQRVATAKATSLGKLVDFIGEAAVERKLNELTDDLAVRLVLRDIAALAEAVSSSPVGSLPPALERLRLLPEALMAWLREHLGLEPYLERGQHLEIPAERLSRFTTSGPINAATGSLVQVVVVDPGWNRNGRQLVPPHVEGAAPKGPTN